MLSLRVWDFQEDPLTVAGNRLEAWVSQAVFESLLSSILFGDTMVHILE